MTAEDASSVYPRRLFWLALVAFGLCLPMILFDQDPGKDTSTYYSPMIRAFSQGDWAHAFWPMISPLFICVGSVFAWLGAAPYTAAKITSALFFAAGIWPTYTVHRRVFGARPAWTAVVLYVLCARLIRYGGAGLLDSGKTFFLILVVSVLLSFWEAQSWRSVLLLAVGGAGLCLIRGDGVIFFAIAAAIALLRETLAQATRLGNIRSWRFPRRSLSALLLAFVLISPWLAYEWVQVGFPALDVRQVTRVQRVAVSLGVQLPPLVGRLPRQPDENLALKKIPGAPPPARQSGSWQASGRARALGEIVSGLFPVYLLLAFPVIAMRIRRRRWTRAETVLLVAIAAHTLLLLAALGVALITKRYVTAAIPLLLGWAALGWQQAADWMHTKQPRHGARVAGGVAVIFALIMAWDGASRARRPLMSGRAPEIRATAACAEWLKTSGTSLIAPQDTALESTAYLYHNGRRLRVVTLEPSLALFADADLVNPRHLREFYDLSAFLEFCELNRVHFVVWDKALAAICPDLKDPAALPAALFTPMNTGATATGMQVFGYRPCLVGQAHPSS
jgi:4-amino-4-deoxy-L-arabinose transferase-like glycosyltransferase